MKRSTAKKLDCMPPVTRGQIMCCGYFGIGWIEIIVSVVDKSAFVVHFDRGIESIDPHIVEYSAHEMTIPAFKIGDQDGRILYDHARGDC